MENKYWITYILLLLIIFSCSEKDSNKSLLVHYNIIQPGNGIYVIIGKNVDKEKTINNYYEAVYYNSNKVMKIERYNAKEQLTDSLAVAAVTKFEYNSDGNVKFIKYYDKDGHNSEDEIFGYWSIEYIYDELNRVRMEIYRDAQSKFLEVPRDNSGSFAKINFLSPVLTYEYLGDKIKIKALDQNFNLLKEVFGDKPCVPFIDCGENE